MSAYDDTASGIVFNIQRFSVHDGPGIRTVVFLKGCSLRCIWCSNPESLKRSEQLGIHPERCIGIDKCDECRRAAPDPDCFIIEDQRVIGLDAERPEDYLACADVCPTNALTAWGRRTMM